MKNITDIKNIINIKNIYKTKCNKIESNHFMIFSKTIITKLLIQKILFLNANLDKM